MFKTGDKKPSVRLDDDFAQLLEDASVPATEVGGVSEEAQRRIGVSRMLDLVPRLFNISVADINDLPADRRKALVDALRTYFDAVGRVRSAPKSGNGAEELAEATKGVNDLVRQYRAALVSTVKSPELTEVMRPPYLKPRTLEFAGDRVARLYAMHLADIDALQPGDRAAIAQPLGLVMQTDESRGDSSSISINQRHIEYGGNYYFDMRAAVKDLEPALVAAGLLPKPMLALMRKAGHDKVRDLVLMELNISAPAVAKLLRNTPAEESATFFGAMDAYVLSGRVTGPEGREFGKQFHALEVAS
ncbi:MAG TPA: hypothetical protein PKV72_01365 [Candidatus Peribacteria bacterium]|nr:hypothetical protein [Candidatus Peribacteria bacterium]